MGTAAVEGSLWSAKPQDWAELAEPTTRPTWAPVLTAAGVGPGTDLLDIGCGAGGLLACARGLGANVTGLDASAALVEIARERNPESRIAVGDMEELPFADASFDVVTGFNSFQFAEDMVNALTQARRVCKSGGRVALLLWGLPENCESVRATFPAVMALLPEPPPAGTSSVSDPGVVEERIESAGLTLVDSGYVDCPFHFRDAENAVRAMCSAGMVVRVVGLVGEVAVKNAIRGTLGPFTLSDGSVLQTNRFRWFIARRDL